MATISKIIAFQTKFNEFLKLQIKEIDVGEDILHKIVMEEITKATPVTQMEEITKAKPVTQIEAILLASATKAAAAKVSPKAAAPKEAPKATGGAGSPPVETRSPTLRYKEVVASTLKIAPIESWADEDESSAAPPAVPAADLPAWKVEALKEFTTFTKVAPKKGLNTYYFNRRTIPEILTSLSDSRTKKHPEDTLMKWLHNLPQEKVGPWLEDVTTRADFRNESSRFTIVTIIYAFIPFFIKHNLTKGAVTHLGYCTSLVAIPEPSTSEVTIAKYFGLGPGDEPTEEMLREVALVQAIQNYVLSEINTLLVANKTKYKIRSIKTSGDIEVSFPSEEAMEKFVSAMKYDMRTDGFL